MSEGTFCINPRDTAFAPLDLREVFGNDRPVVLEIGSGKGRFLIESAMERPSVNFIGIEKALHYHRLIRDRVEKRGLTNIRLINHDAFLVMQKMLAPESISEIHIYFPDPWPRKREQKRRIIRAEALQEMKRVLTPDGFGVYVTDHQDYFEAAYPEIPLVFQSEHRSPGPDDPPRTNYEAKYRIEGRPIFEAKFWKP